MSWSIRVIADNGDIALERFANRVSDARSNPYCTARERAMLDGHLRCVVEQVTGLQNGVLIASSGHDGVNGYTVTRLDVDTTFDDLN